MQSDVWYWLSPEDVGTRGARAETTQSWASMNQALVSRELRPIFAATNLVTMRPNILH